MLTHFQRRWMRKHRCKLAGGLKSLNKNSTLILEETAQLGELDIHSALLTVGAYSYIRSRGTLEQVRSIGRFCSIGNHVHIGLAKRTHPIDWVSSHPFQYTNTAHQYAVPLDSVTIGHDVWIGSHAVILEGANIASGAIIAAHAVVSKDVPAYAIVAGNPAKIIRYRHDDAIIDKLLASQWWDYSIDDLKQLPLDAPELFISELAHKQYTKKVYKKIKLTHNSYALLK